ncbi:MAG: hypothetical protein HQK57_07440 [Deltaproteobacteria bacterium]|nr:hypothetical protein [Deltaproteobacteria bacterium]
MMTKDKNLPTNKVIPLKRYAKRKAELTPSAPSLFDSDSDAFWDPLKADNHSDLYQLLERPFDGLDFIREMESDWTGEVYDTLFLQSDLIFYFTVALTDGHRIENFFKGTLLEQFITQKIDGDLDIWSVVTDVKVAAKLIINYLVDENMAFSMKCESRDDQK